MLRALLLIGLIGSAGCQGTTKATRAERDFLYNGKASAPARDAKGDSLNGFTDVLAMVSPGVIPAQPDLWTNAKVDVANADMAPAAGRPITLTLTAREVIRWQEGFALNGKPCEDYKGEMAYWIYFQPSNARSAATLNLGETATVKGKLNAIRFEQNPAPFTANRPRLYVEVDNAKIVERHAAR